MTQPIMFTRHTDGATFNFICQRTTNHRDGQPRLTVKVFETEKDAMTGVPVSYVKVPGTRLNSKSHLYTMSYKFMGDNRQYFEFVNDFMDAVEMKLQEENA